MIAAVIFDMDGLLIDSEPLWGEAEVKIFGALGIPLTLAMTTQTTGLRSDELVEYWQKKYPSIAIPKQETTRSIENTVHDLIKTRGLAKPGVDKAIGLCQDMALPIAIASSSSLLIINTVLEKLSLNDKVSVTQSARDEKYGKPHPAVYLATAAKLGVHPNDCIALEDSINGVLSAKAAKMKCIAVPEPNLFNDKRFGIADTILHTLNELTVEILKDL